MSFFKAYDMRGTFGVDFDLDVVYNAGLHLPAIIRKKNAEAASAAEDAPFRVLVGRDARVSSPSVAAALIAGLAAAGAQVYGTFLDGEDLYSKPLETGRDCPAVIVIGNESNGISAPVAACTTARLLIPAFPRGKREGPESLNAAVAAAVTVAEFRRQYYAQK